MEKNRKKIYAILIAFAVVITSISHSPIKNVKAADDISVYYRTHIQTFGWEGESGKTSTWKKDGEMSGTSGKAKRLEGIEIAISGNSDLGIQYTTHCQSYGWLPWSADGEMNGTEGEAKRLEAIKIKLTGADASKYDVYYRVHAQTYGWLSWAKNGQAAGTAGLAKRLEGIQVVVLPKGETLPSEYKGIKATNDKAYINKTGASDEDVSGADETNVTYKTHVQTFGWQGWRYNGKMSGTSGLAKRLEGINIKLTNKEYDGGITYRTHVQTYGWQGWVSNGKMSGTSGEAKRLESIQIYLTGDMAKHYDLYYRVHAQTYGWLGWVKNGEPAGTAGFGKRLEGIQIVLVGKGVGAPGNVGGIVSVSPTGFEYASATQIPENPYVEPSRDNQSEAGGDNQGGTDNAGGTENTEDDNSTENNNTTEENNSTEDDNTTEESNTTEDTTTEEEEIDITDYTYKVTPLAEDVCNYFYVETDNPDPSSFMFRDENTVIESSTPCNMYNYCTKLADVVYTNPDTYRVSGGYIFYCESTDGGELKLYYKKGKNKGKAADVTVTIPMLRSKEQYLIDTYTDSSMTFWEKMDAVEEGLSGICLYSGVVVRGNIEKSEDFPYCGIANSSYADQKLYMTSTHHYTNDEYTLISRVYPFILKSIAYPAMLGRIAKMLDESAVYEWDDYFHYMINITYNGETKAYGGAGVGGGQTITKDLIKYYYTFDGSKEDASTMTSWKETHDMLIDYGSMEVPDDSEYFPSLTWKDVRDTVGVEGAYIKIYLLREPHSGYNGDGYSYIFETKEASTLYITNAWYDGRYFNEYEYFEKGTTFDDPDASTANIIIKDPIILFPEPPEGKELVYMNDEINHFEGYDSETGVWSGYEIFRYDEATKEWINGNHTSFYYRDTATGEYTYITDDSIRDSWTLTIEDVMAMDIDRNADTYPETYYNYDTTVEPGTPGRN